MSRLAHGHARRTAAVLLALAATSLTAVVPAQADESPAPVTGDDTATVRALTGEYGGIAFIDVLANDRSATGEPLEICRVEAPERGLSVAEVAPDGSFTITTPSSGSSVAGSTGLGDDAAQPGARESLAVLPWANRNGTFRFTYWACDTEHLTPATVTVTVEKTPQVTVRKTDRPGRLRFNNPRSGRVVVVYAGARQDRPDGVVRLAPRRSETRRVEHRSIIWVAFSPRTGEPCGTGIVRGIRLPASASRGTAVPADVEPELTARMIRAWRSATRHA